MAFLLSPTCMVSADELVVPLFFTNLISFSEIKNLKNSWITQRLHFLYGFGLNFLVLLRNIKVNGWLFGAFNFFPSKDRRLQWLFMCHVQWFWCFTFSCTGLILGKAAIIEIETKSYNSESGELLCMNRWVLSETIWCSPANFVSYEKIKWKERKRIREKKVLPRYGLSKILFCRMTTYFRGAGGFSNSYQPFSYSNNPTNKASAVKIPKSRPFAVYEDCTQPSQACKIDYIILS